MQDFPSNAFGLAHLWTSGDALSHAVAVILALMSVAFWYLILVKTLDWRRLCRAARFDPAGQMERAPRQQISRIHADLHVFFTLGRPLAANGIPPRPLEDALENARGVRVEAA